jgi:hypothetical protein
VIPIPALTVLHYLSLAAAVTVLALLTWHYAAKKPNSRKE